MDPLLDSVCQGDRRCLARAMSLVDEAGPEAEALKDSLRRSTGEVPWWGFTGPPGVGKSTLIDALLSILRRRGCRIGVVAVDPSSPISDGALLGDRVRMMRHAVDPDVFIRSLAARHREGGLSDAALHCARLLELAHYDPVLIETVGVGQNEVDIASVADICVVVLGPGYGDDIQLIKAGLLEVADLVVVNKCDRPEANRLLQEVHAELETSRRRNVETSKPNRDREGAEEVGSAVRTSSSAVRTSSSAMRTSSSAVRTSSSAVRTSSSAVEIVGVEAKSGKGVEELLEKLLEMDRAARGAEQGRRHSHRRVLGEIRRYAMWHCGQALERGLGTPAARELVAELQRGERSLEFVVKELLACGTRRSAKS